MKLPIILTLALVSLTGCGGGEEQRVDPTPLIGLSTTAKIESAGGGGAGGGAKIPPSPTIDGPAWFFTNGSSVGTVGFSPNIDFGRIQNTSAGGIPVGSSRSATELIYNISKKTSLTVSDIRITGADPGDFFISPQAISSAATTVLPPNKGAAEAVHITFTPTAEGVRTASVVFTSAAGVVQISLTGVGLPTRPILSGLGPVTFFPDSAPDTFIVQNTGGSSLVLNAIGIGGANPAAFALRVANSGSSNCFAGEPLAPLSFCFIAVSEVAGAAAPASANLVILSNDPVNPKMTVPLTLVSSP